MLSVLADEITIAEAARREKVSEQSIGRWKLDFLEGGKTALVAGKSGPSTREQQLEDEVAELTQALGEAAVEIRVWKKSAEAGWALRGPRGDPRGCGHADREVREADRRARAVVSPLAGEGSRRRLAEGSVAAAGEGRRPAAGDKARAGEAGVGSPEDLGADPARRAPGVAGDRAAAAAR
ncbi:hypothetical protein [Microbacterium oryzae]|uniref:hypothetical protein n=1 Tax=Microbacterium oryzae TaxID=743009 RepID=UPI001FE696AF|nr:hypothetical protein [Microbacterium oryzae]